MLAIVEPRSRSRTERFYRPSRDAPVFCFISQHFVLGYFHQVPCGTNFLQASKNLGDPDREPLIKLTRTGGCRTATANDQAHFETPPPKATQSSSQRRFHCLDI